jgi:outer membrane protein assembly factor BamD
MPSELVARHRSYVGLIVVIAAMLALQGCSAFGEKNDPTRGWSAQRLYNGAKERLDEGDFDQAIDYYEKLESRYPFGVLAQQGQLEIAYAYYRHDEPDSALAAADRFIKLYPDHKSLDYAYYLKGLTNSNRGRSLVDRFIAKDPSERDTESVLQAFRDFEVLVERFPDSKYAGDAEQRMLFLRDTLAKHELYVANYYMRRGAYLAAVNRAKYIVENYPTTNVVSDALVLLAKGYKVMGLHDLSADAVRVLRLNFPEHEGIGEVEQLVLN